MTAYQGVYMKIRIHYRDQHSGPWTTAIAEADQIPRMSDFEEVQSETLGEVGWRG
jgi:hypothetical protein